MVPICVCITYGTSYCLGLTNGLIVEVEPRLYFFRLKMILTRKRCVCVCLGEGRESLQASPRTTSAGSNDFNRKVVHSFLLPEWVF